MWSIITIAILFLCPSLELVVLWGLRLRCLCVCVCVCMCVCGVWVCGGQSAGCAFVLDQIIDIVSFLFVLLW